MPHLVKMDKKYSDKGLRILAPEVQGSSVEDIEKLVKEHKINYPIMKGSTRAPNMKGIPHSVVFNPAGEIVFEGHPMNPDFDKSIKTALKDVKVADADDKGGLFAKPLIAERTWTNSEGKPLVASVIAIKGENVEFKLKTGRKIPYPIAKLSEDDQELIKKASSGSDEDDE
ncbi:hypothetical protein N9A94_03210 [Akkermansiaceae bacterium]|nr:hypothetical protein [Akkermansiaceae bacterium]MDA7888176.1 hypothetical protein [Akkermansiaceae bacterium]MDB4537692.1 hypothetical protein [Akkermansiaceae bacterium]